MVSAWQQWLALVIGVWLFIAPFIGFGETASAAWNSWIMAAAVVILSIAAITRPRRWLEWGVLAAGFWLVIAPFALGLTGLPGTTGNQLIAGLLLGAKALWALQVPNATERERTASR